jgi:hypothetical protein
MGEPSTIIGRTAEAWRRSAHLHTLNPGASDVELATFEQRVGWDLPAEWRELFRIANGAALLDGNVRLYPLTGTEFSLLEASEAHRRWNWPIPEQLCLAGDNGSGDLFGLWLPSRTPMQGAVVQTGEIFALDGLALAATSLESFLLAKTAYYLLLLEADVGALDALGLPHALRSTDPDDETWRDVLKWADPSRPTTPDDPYEARLNTGGLNALLGITD